MIWFIKAKIKINSGKILFFLNLMEMRMEMQTANYKISKNWNFCSFYNFLKRHNKIIIIFKIINKNILKSWKIKVYVFIETLYPTFPI